MINKVSLKLVIALISVSLWVSPLWAQGLDPNAIEVPKLDAATVGGVVSNVNQIRGMSPADLAADQIKKIDVSKFTVGAVDPVLLEQAKNLGVDLLDPSSLMQASKSGLGSLDSKLARQITKVGLNSLDPQLLDKVVKTGLNSLDPKLVDQATKLGLQSIDSQLLDKAMELGLSSLDPKVLERAGKMGIESLLVSFDKGMRSIISSPGATTQLALENKVLNDVLPRVEAGMQDIKQTVDVLQAIDQNEQLQNIVKSSGSIDEVGQRLQEADKSLFYNNRWGAEPEVVSRSFAEDSEIIQSEFENCQTRGHSYSKITTEPRWDISSCMSRLALPSDVDQVLAPISSLGQGAQLGAGLLDTVTKTLGSVSPGLSSLLSDSAIIGLLSNPQTLAFLGNPAFSSVFANSQLIALLGDSRVLSMISDLQVMNVLQDRNLTGVLENTMYASVFSDNELTAALDDFGVQEILKDTQALNAFRDGNVAAVMANPKYRGVFADSKLNAAMRDSRVLTMLDDAQAVMALKDGNLDAVRKDPKFAGIFADNELTAAMNDLGVQEILKDTQAVNALRSGDLAVVMKNQRYIDVFANSKLTAAMRDSRVLTMLDDVQAVKALQNRNFMAVVRNREFMSLFGSTQITALPGASQIFSFLSDPQNLSLLSNPQISALWGNPLVTSLLTNPQLIAAANQLGLGSVAALIGSVASVGIVAELLSPVGNLGKSISGKCGFCIPDPWCGCHWVITDLVTYSFPTFKLDASEQPYQSLYLDEALVSGFATANNEMMEAQGQKLALENLRISDLSSNLTLKGLGVDLPESSAASELPADVDATFSQLPAVLRTTVGDSSRVYTRNIAEPLNMQTSSMWWIPHVAKSHFFGSDLPPFLPLASRSFGISQLSALASPTLMQKFAKFVSPGGVFSCVDANKRRGKTAIDLDTPNAPFVDDSLCLKNIGERYPLTDSRRVSITDRTWRGVAKDLDLFQAVVPEGERHSYDEQKDRMLVLRNEKLRRETPQCRPLEEMTRVNIDYKAANVKNVKSGGENTVQVFTEFRGCWGFKGRDLSWWLSKPGGFVVAYDGDNKLRLQ